MRRTCSIPALAVVLSLLLPCAAKAQIGIPRMPDGRPDLRGIWQTLNTANFDIQDHAATLGVPAGQSVVDGNEQQYTRYEF